MSFVVCEAIQRGTSLCFILDEAVEVVEHLNRGVFGRVMGDAALVLPEIPCNVPELVVDQACPSFGQALGAYADIVCLLYLLPLV